MKPPSDALCCAVLRWRQVMSGFPVVAVLMCIEDHSQLVLTIDGFIDQLHKLLRDRRAASMAVLCLCRVAACFIRRMAARSDAGGWRGMCEVGERCWYRGVAATVCYCRLLFTAAMCPTAAPPLCVYPLL